MYACSYWIWFVTKGLKIVFNFCLSYFSLGFEFLNNKLASFYLIAILLMWTGSICVYWCDLVDSTMWQLFAPNIHSECYTFQLILCHMVTLPLLSPLNLNLIWERVSFFFLCVWRFFLFLFNFYFVNTMMVSTESGDQIAQLLWTIIRFEIAQYKLHCKIHTN